MTIADPVGNLALQDALAAAQQLGLYAYTSPAARLSSLSSKCAPIRRGIRRTFPPHCVQDRLKWSLPATFLLELVPAADNGSVTFKPSFEEVHQILDNAVEEAVKAVCGIPRQGNAEAPAGSWVCCS